MADQNRISVTTSENQYVISNIHTASGAVAGTTGDIQHQSNPAIILNDENGVEQPIINTAEQYPTYMAIATHQSQGSQASSGSRRARYTSLHHGHTYESIGNPAQFVGAQMNQQNGVGKCVRATMIVLLMLILLVAVATLAIATFTMWYLFNEVNDIKDLLGRLESRNCTTESAIHPDELMNSQVVNTLSKYIVNAIYERLYYYYMYVW